MSKVELTNMIMIQNPETQEVVVQRRVKYWCGCTFPGGHVENGESIYDSAVREVKEELGITLKLEEIELMMSYRRKHDFVDVWLVRKDINIEDIVMQPEEVAAVKWVTVPELENMIQAEETPQSLKIYFNFLKDLIG